MGTFSVLPLRSLAEGFVLAPERYDPKRQVEVEADIQLQDLFDIVTENISPKSVGEQSVLVLDTTHAYEGFVLYRHAPGTPDDIGSAKRRLRPGDVIISRLRPYLRQVAFVDDALFSLTEGGNAVVASTEFYVLRAKGSVPAAALVPYLLCEGVQSALAASQEGGHHPRFTRDTLANLPLPEWIFEEAATVTLGIRSLADSVRRSMMERDRLVRQASDRLPNTSSE